MSPIRILAICVHNGARSQMAEEYLRRFGGDLFEVMSAGLEPGAINPVVTRLLAEDGIDIRGKQTRSVFDLYRDGAKFDYVIAVCDREAAERCPIFPAERERLHWPFPDPSKATGNEAETLEFVRSVRDAIRERAKAFSDSIREKR